MRKQEFESLLHKHQAALARVAASYEAIPALREELQQDIALAIWRALPKFNGQSAIKTYLLSIAHKRGISHVARHARRPGHSSLDETAERAATDCPQSSVQQHQQSEQLLQAIRQLPLLQRELVGMALEGMSYQEIAIAQGISVNNVGVRLNRAKKQLQQLMSY